MFYTPKHQRSQLSLCCDLWCHRTARSRWFLSLVHSFWNRHTFKTIRNFTSDEILSTNWPNCYLLWILNQNKKTKFDFFPPHAAPILTTNSLCVYFVNDLIDEVRYVGAWWWGKFSLCRLWFSLFGTSNSEELVRWSVYAYGMEHTNNNDSNRWGWERRGRVTSERRDIEIQRELWKAWIFITSSQEWRWRQETRGLRSFHGEMVERMLWG